MISNARAESEVMNSRCSGSNNGHGSVLTSTEDASDYDGGKRDDGLPLSDSEAGAYDEDIDTLGRRIGGSLDRESV